MNGGNTQHQERNCFSITKGGLDCIFTAKSLAHEAAESDPENALLQPIIALLKEATDCTARIPE